MILLFFSWHTRRCVVSLNLHRRHLNESQRAMVAAKLATLQQGDNSNAPIGALAQSQAADLLNVSRRAAQRAAVVRDDATPELARAVEAGRVSVSAAADVATLPKQEQAEIVAMTSHGIQSRLTGADGGNFGGNSRRNRALRLTM